MASLPQLPRTTEIVLRHLEERSRAAGEDASLLAFRNQAKELLFPLQLPNRARHLWRYTDATQFIPLVDPTETVAKPVISTWRLDEPLAGSAVIACGVSGHMELSDAARQAGVVITDLHTHPELDRLGQAVPATHGFIEALNAAAFAGGVLVKVPAGVHLDQPIRLRIIASPAGSLTLPRILVIGGKDSSFEIIEDHLGGGKASRVLGVSEMFIGEGADVRYALVQRWSPGVIGHITSRARVEARASFQMALASFGGSVYKADVGAILTGEHANVETFGVAMGGDRQHFDHHTEHIHSAPKTHSNLDFKVALTDSSRSAYTGLIRIAPHAGQTEAYQENRNLLLSGNARAQSIPELEILTDDVKCSHGATVAPLDSEQLFYLQSRGLAPNQAMRVIVYGFLDQTLQRLPEKTRERIEALVAARLHED